MARWMTLIALQTMTKSEPPRATRAGQAGVLARQRAKGLGFKRTLAWLAGCFAAIQHAANLHCTQRRVGWLTCQLWFSGLSAAKFQVAQPLALPRLKRFLAPEPEIALLHITTSVLYSQFERCKGFRVSRFACNISSDLEAYVCLTITAQPLVTF